MLALTLAIPCWADEPEAQLRANPFVRPILVRDTPAAPAASTPVRSVGPPTVLRFALAAGPDSLVNVDGKTLRLGEEINGYRLEAVRESAAIFRNGDKLLELRMQVGDVGTAK